MANAYYLGHGVIFKNTNEEILNLSARAVL